MIINFFLGSENNIASLLGLNKTESLLLIAIYLASVNPESSDLRIFAKNKKGRSRNIKENKNFDIDNIKTSTNLKMKRIIFLYKALANDFEFAVSESWFNNLNLLSEKMFISFKPSQNYLKINANVSESLIKSLGSSMNIEVDKYEYVNQIKV